MEWALQKINNYRGDTTKNRAARIEAAVMYGLAVAIARRGKEPIPPRPDVEGAA